MGFAERVMPASAENDNRPDYARLHLSRTLIAVREAQMHQLAIRYGMTRWMMPGTDPSRARSEFFKGTLQQALRALKGVGVGDLYTFGGNNISQITKQTLKRGDAIETQQVPLRKSERLEKPSFLPGTYSINKETDPQNASQNASATFLPATYSIDKATADALTQGDATTARAIERLGQVRKSPRLAGEPIVFQATPGNLERLVQGGRKATRAAQALRQVRRSPRLNTGVVG